jgi:hypothetical protein
MTGFQTTQKKKIENIIVEMKNIFYFCNWVRVKVKTGCQNADGPPFFIEVP